MYLERIQEILANTEKIIIDQGRDSDGAWYLTCRSMN